VTLSRGRQSERFRVEEADGPVAVSVLRAYMGEIRVIRPYFDAFPDSADEDVAAELPRHPVFQSHSRGEWQSTNRGGHMRSDVRAFIRRLEVVGLTVESTPAPTTSSATAGSSPSWRQTERRC
jgi:hypothetical protein